VVAQMSSHDARRLAVGDRVGVTVEPSGVLVVAEVPAS
jgi:hypothetical protein